MYNNIALICHPAIRESNINILPPYERKSREGILLKDSNLDLPTFWGANQKTFNYSQYRRFVVSISRLNYLRYIEFDFGRCSAITFTISNDFINYSIMIRNALHRIDDYFRRLGIKFYIVAKELGEETNRLHYHYILINAPYLEPMKVSQIWNIGTDIKFKEIKNYGYGVAGGVAYITNYIKKGLNLQWSRAFFKEKILSNEVYYLVDYDKKTKKVYIDNIFNASFISKKDYRIFKNKLESAKLANLYWQMIKKIIPDYAYYLRMAAEAFEK